MKVTNADVAKRALFGLLDAQTQVSELLYDVQVDYVDPAQDSRREAIFFGLTRSAIQQEADFPLETATFPCYVQVSVPELDPQAAEQRAIAIGQVVRDLMKVNPLPCGPNSWWHVVATELAAGRSADESRILLTLMVQVISYL
jgi:hypothetical protein